MIIRQVTAYDARVVEHELSFKPRYIDKGEVARRLGISVPTVQRMMRAGHITVYKIEGTRMVRFDVEEVDALARRQEAPYRPLSGAEEATG